MKYFSRLSFLFSTCFVVCVSISSAAENPAENKPKEGPELKVVNLTVYPAPITRPAMKYRLLPRVADQTPGNAALLYDTIFIRIAEEDGIRDGQSRDLKDEKEKEKYFTNADKLSNWLETPLSELPKDEIRKILDNVQPWFMEYAEMASHRIDCDWDLPTREMSDPFEMRLPELYRARSLARILAMKARLSLAEGKPDDALKTLQIGFALSQQIGKGKMLVVNYLVANSLANMMGDQLLDLTQLKDAPNLYWSLSNLPHPFLNYRDAVELEELGFERLTCELQEAKKGQHSPEQWQKLGESLIDKINSEIVKLADYTKIQHKEKYDAKKTLEDYYPQAQEYLINLGWPKKEIQSMAPAQVVLLSGAEVWKEIHDENTKWLGISYSQWPSNLREHYEDLVKDYKQLPLVEFLPAIGAIARAQARTEKQLESLRLIEAIRLYAFSHNGKLPGTLDDIKEVPVPANPMTGKPFPYLLEGDTAVLMADGDPDMRANYEYRIKIAK